MKKIKQLRLLWQQIPAVMVTDILTNTDKFHGVVLDIEHGAFSAETMYACLALGLAKGKQMFARFAYLDRHMIRVALDAGATGIILSTVNTAEEANAFRSFCYYPEHSGLRGQGLVRENQWGKLPLVPQRKPVLVMQIETRQAVESLIGLVALNFDYYMLCHYELSSSLGITGDFEKTLYKRYCMSFMGGVPKAKQAVHFVQRLQNRLCVPGDYGLVACSIDTRAIVDNVTHWEGELESVGR